MKFGGTTVKCVIDHPVTSGAKLESLDDLAKSGFEIRTTMMRNSTTPSAGWMFGGGLGDAEPYHINESKLYYA